MFNNVNTLQQAIERIQNANKEDEFQAAISATISYLREQHYASEVYHTINQLAYYQKNEYSDKNNSENIESAKQRVTSFIKESIMWAPTEGQFSDNEKLRILYIVLERFQDFLVDIRKRTPHQKASIKKDVYEQLIVQNEYDLQFLLYAYLKPIFQDIRDEVAVDADYSNDRIDFVIGKNIAIETKCTRDSMTIKKLMEEIAADITLYPFNNIFVYVYDKKGIIDNVQAFKQAFCKEYGTKKVYVIVAQGREL